MKIHSRQDSMSMHKHKQQLKRLKWFKAVLSRAQVAREIKGRNFPRCTLWFLFCFVFFLVLLHTATANGFQMVTSGAQSKAINDWLIPSVEVSCVWVQTGGVVGCLLLSGLQQTFGLMEKSGESQPGWYLMSLELRPLQTQRACRSRAVFVRVS